MTNPLRPAEQTVAVILPIRKLDENGCPIFVRRRGRQRRIERVPTVSQAAYHEAVAAEVHRAIEQDEVVVATSADDPKTVLEKTMTAVACEAAALGWERARAQREGKAEAERISSRRVAALVRLAELAVVREQMQREDPEPRPEHVEAIVAMLMEELEATVREVAPAEVAERFVGKLKQKLSASNLPYPTATT